MKQRNNEGVQMTPLSAVSIDPPEAPEPARDAQEFEEILYHVTHDLRASLRAILMLPDWIREDLEKSTCKVPPSVLQDLDLLQAQTRRADQMLIDLRTYSRVGRRSDSPSLIDLAEIVEEVRRDRRLPDSFTLKTALDGACLRAPRNDIKTLIGALVENAHKHHPGGGGEIRVSGRGDGDMVWLTVEDDGNGIEPQFRQKVFDLLATLRPRDECEGTGAGLAICKKIVGMLGGTIAIGASSQLGGACVRVELPR